MRSQQGGQLHVVRVHGLETGSVGAPRRRGSGWIERLAFGDGDEERLGTLFLVFDANAEVEVGAGRGARHEELTALCGITGSESVTSGQAVAVGVLRSIVAADDDSDTAGPGRRE